MGLQMDRETKLEAGALATALSWEYAELDEAVGWADRLIEVSTIPDDRIIRLALVKSKSEGISILHEILGPFDKWTVLRKFFGRFASKEKLTPEEASDLAKNIFKQLKQTEITTLPAPKEFQNFWGLWDDIDLAIDGISGDPIEVSAMILKEIKLLAL